MLNSSILKKFKPKTMNIKGKDYITVAERVKQFYKACEAQGVEGSIETFLLEHTEKSCIFQAKVYINGKLASTGYATEDQDSSYINKTSFLENCETSAVGRALGFAGVGVDEDIASAEEVVGASAKEEFRKSDEFLQKYKCSECGKVVVGSRGRTAEQIIEGTKKAYGRILCIDCALDANSAAPKVPEEDSNEQKNLFQEVIDNG